MLYNLEKVNPNYTVQLFVCLPELWEKVKYEDMKSLIENFTNSFSFYSLIEYTYKYLEIDIFEEIISNKNIDLRFKKDCITFFQNTITILYMEEFDYLEFEENLFGISRKRLDNLREKFKQKNSFKNSLPQEKLYDKLTSVMYQMC